MMAISTLSAGRARAASAAAAAVIAGLFLGSATRMDPVDASTLLHPAKAAALVNATSGDESTRMRAIGDEAKAINAALPFSESPVAPARPFALAGTTLDKSRALLCLTQAVYYEAGFEPGAGRRAVAQVVLNRMRHPAFPKSVCGVVYQSSRSRVCQFTFVCDGALYRQPEPGAWRQARAIAEAALAGYVERSVGSATHYHADYVAPRWAPLLSKVAQIGTHIFYRWPGGWGQPQAFLGRYIGEPADPAALRLSLTLVAGGVEIPNVTKQAGPPIRRAPNDVGGLIDTSKGWTLKIPDPRESNSTASRVIADQEGPSAAPPVDIALATPASSDR